MWFFISKWYLFQAISIWLQAKSAVIFSCDWENSGKFASCVWSLLVKLVVSSCGKIDGSTLLSDLFTCPRDWLQTLRSRLATPQRGFWTAPLDLSALYLGLVRRWWNLVLEIFDPDRMAWIGHETLCKICNRYLPHRNFNLMKMYYKVTGCVNEYICHTIADDEPYPFKNCKLHDKALQQSCLPLERCHLKATTRAPKQHPGEVLYCQASQC